MLTKLIIRNFKRFKSVEIELGNPVVFIGPNNSGKTSALQALSLWELGLRHWTEKRKGQKTPEKRPGITINRQDLIMLPVPGTKLLWHELRVKKPGTQGRDPAFIDVRVQGITRGAEWKCGFEFYYANEESFYCRPLRLSEAKNPERMFVPEEAEGVRLAFLPPMSGLAAAETRLDEGAINVRIGEGRTAEVLRNLCYKVYQETNGSWERLTGQIQRLFGCELNLPEYIAERGEVTMSYSERGITLDLSSSGRGLQQTLLVLAYMYANPGAVLLLDEPAAHLEMLRQRQTYELLTDVARENDNQIIAASHSEVLLNEAASKDTVVAFVGRPHRMLAARKDEVLKSLKEIGYDQYYLAEQTGWVLYLEGETDLDILRAFAKRLDHQGALKALERPFVRYTTDITGGVNKHFYPLREAFPDLKGVALFDRHDKSPADEKGLVWLMWERREIESYLCFRDVLIAYAESTARKKAPGLVFEAAEVKRRGETMQKEIATLEDAMKTLKKGSPWDGEMKVSDEFLTPLFENYYEKLGLYNDMAKRSFHELVDFVPVENLSGEVKQKLDAIAEVAKQARPVSEAE
ncbi:MAG TPA: AAA family ATPase [bacterium]|nr:AAA family ATPase [bacterium]